MAYPALTNRLNDCGVPAGPWGGCGTAALWVVSGSNGENAARAEGRAQAEAWWRACGQARAVGMLAPAAFGAGGRR